jgi:cation diffusion facilitator family transporter
MTFLERFQKPIPLNLFLLIIYSTLIVFKFYFALLTNSVALQADAYDNFSDIIMTLTGLVGLYFSNKKPNEKFPYGYYKLENIISLLISIFIFFTAYNIIQQAFIEIYNFFSGSEKVLNITPEVFVFLLISQIITIFVAISLKVVANKTKSPIIESEAKEKIYDIFISLSIIMGFIGAFFGFPILDSMFAVIITVFMIKGGYDIFKISIKTLLDAVIDFENKTTLYNLIESFPKIKKIMKLDVRSYGKYIIVEVNVLLRREMPLFEIKDLKDKLNKKIITTFPQVFKATIVAESQELQTYKIAVPIVNNNGNESKISEHFGDSGFFALITFQEENILKFEVINNAYIHEEKRKGILISDWLCSEKIDKIFLKKELKRGPMLIFENAMISIALTDKETLAQIIEDEINLIKS